MFPKSDVFIQNYNNIDISSSNFNGYTKTLEY